MFSIELKKAFSRHTFKVVILIGMIFCVLNIVKYNFITGGGDYIESYLKGYMSTSYDNFIAFNLSPFANILFIIFPLISALVYSDSYLEDTKSGFIKFIYTRTNKTKYLLSKFFSNFVVAGIAFTVPLLINFIAIILLFPSMQPHPILGKITIMQGGLFPELYYSHPVAYIFMWISIYFLYAGAFASIGLALGLIIKNKFVTIILPFIMCMVIEIIAELSNKIIYSPQQFLYLSNGQSIYVIIGEFVFIFVISIILFFYGGYKSETY